MDVYTNITTPGPPPQPSRNTLAYVHFVIGTYILLSNGLVVLSVYTFHYLKTRANLYIVSLASTDMCVGLMEWLIGLHNHDILASWFDRTAWACVGIFCFAFFAVACSMFNMVLIALDRLLYIMKPFFYTREVRSQRVKLAILLVWLLAAAWASIPLYIHTYDETTDHHCTMQAAIPSVYRAYANVPLLFAGAMTTGGVYITIARVAIRHKKAIFKSIPGYSSHGKKLSVNAGDLTEAARSAIHTMTSNMKTLKLFVIVFGLLIVCWLPYYVIEFTSDFVSVPDVLYRASTALGFLNSGVNFFVYPMYNKQFRRAFKTLICPCLKNPLERSYSTSMTFVSTSKPSSRGGGSRPKPDLGQFNALPVSPPPTPPPPATKATIPAVGTEPKLGDRPAAERQSSSASDNVDGGPMSADTMPPTEVAYPRVNQDVPVPPHQFEASTSQGKTAGRHDTDSQVPAPSQTASDNMGTRSLMTPKQMTCSQSQSQVMSLASAVRQGEAAASSASQSRIDSEPLFSFLKLKARFKREDW